MSPRASRRSGLLWQRPSAPLPVPVEAFNTKSWWGEEKGVCGHQIQRIEVPVLGLQVPDFRYLAFHPWAPLP